MQLTFHLSEKAERVNRFVLHDVKIVEQMGGFLKPRTIVMRYRNEANDMMLGGFKVEWFPGYLVFTPEHGSSIPLIKSNKQRRRDKPLVLSHNLTPKYKKFFGGLIRTQVGYVYKLES